MAVTAFLAMLLVIARACIQSITIDEAASYLTFVGRSQPFQWYPAEANHILNSALMRLFTSVFGLSHVTVRAPAMLGAAIYIGAAWYVCGIITDRVVIQWPVFVCLVYNPFVFDFLVAARGYGLASAFLLCAVAIPAGQRLRGLLPPLLVPPVLPSSPSRLRRTFPLRLRISRSWSWSGYGPVPASDSTPAFSPPPSYQDFW